MKALDKFLECNKERELRTVFLVSGVRNGIQYVGLFTSKSMEKACAGLETVISQELYCIAHPTAPPLTMKLIHGLVENHPVKKEETVAKMKPATLKIQKQVLINQLLRPSISKNLDKGVFSTSGSGSFDLNLNTIVVDEMEFEEHDDEQLCQELNAVEERLGCANKKPEVYSSTMKQDSISNYMIKLHQPSKPSKKWLNDLERDFQYIERCSKEEESFLLAQSATGVKEEESFQLAQLDKLEKEEESFLLAELARVEEGSEIKEKENLVEASSEHEKVKIKHLELC